MNPITHAQDKPGSTARTGARPHAKFVTAVWGQAYIERFATLSLPSFLAPGNLPALAAATELEVVILTRKADVELFEGLAAMRRLQAVCAVRFIDIEDLVATGVYGVTLTLAYARAVIGCGSEMLNTHFVFMNADFVLADGSLRSLAKHILAGRSIVLGPSFRATAEAVEPALRAAVNADGILAIAPRQLAALSLPHPHPTTEAKVRNQQFVHSSHPNQFFWRVDRQTLLGRYYLIFMLCLKPERIIESINCYCDYSFIPEFCPSGDEVAMGDSDQFFMLELQRHDQELEMLRLGRQSNAQIARTLGEWTTAEHRRAAKHDIVFHAGDIPPGIDAARAQAAEFVADIARRLRRARPHANHIYWVRGVAAWRERRKAMGLAASPPELIAKEEGLLSKLLSTLQLATLVHWTWNLIYASYRGLLGQWPKVSLFHYAWMDRRHLEQAIQEAFDARDGDPVLVVRAEAAQLDPLIESSAPARIVDLKSLLDGTLPAEQGRCRSALVYLQHADLPSIRTIVERCRGQMAPVSACRVFVHERRAGAPSSTLASKIVANLDAILNTPSSDTTCTFVGGAIKGDVQMLSERVLQISRYYGLRGMPWALLLLAVTLTAGLLNNFYLRLSGLHRDYVPNCSSVSIRFGAESAAAPARPVSEA